MNLPEFKNFPRAIAIDLDGTLLNSQAQLSVRSLLALERCIEAGIPIMIATSRPLRIFDRIFTEYLKQRCSYIVMNGAVAKGNPPLFGYYKEIIPMDILRKVITYSLEFDSNIRITLEIDGYGFGTNWQWDPLTLWQRNAATPEMIMNLGEAIALHPCKIALGNTDVIKLSEHLETQFGKLLSIVGARYTTALSNPLINITTSTATKPYALRKLLEPHCISLEKVLAFGDDLPDIDMLRECGTSVAMANALPEVKTVCNYETVSNDEDGVALVLETMLEQIQIKSKDKNSKP
jgi:Cof subfamily protein (haloacid dehalogenase superfamily)